MFEIRKAGVLIKFYIDATLAATVISNGGKLLVDSSFHDVGGVARNCLARGLSNPDDDSDGDGMTDGWEDAHGLNPHSASDGGSTDSDSDGFSNLEEFLAGSDPDDGGSDPGAQPIQAPSTLVIHTPLDP